MDEWIEEWLLVVGWGNHLVSCIWCWFVAELGNENMAVMRCWYDPFRMSKTILCATHYCVMKDDRKLPSHTHIIIWKTNQTATMQPRTKFFGDVEMFCACQRWLCCECWVGSKKLACAQRHVETSQMRFWLWMTDKCGKKCRQQNSMVSDHIHINSTIKIANTTMQQWINNDTIDES